MPRRRAYWHIRRQIPLSNWFGGQGPSQIIHRRPRHQHPWVSFRLQGPSCRLSKPTFDVKGRTWELGEFSDTLNWRNWNGLWGIWLPEKIWHPQWLRCVAVCRECRGSLENHWQIECFWRPMRQLQKPSRSVTMRMKAGFYPGNSLTESGVGCLLRLQLPINWLHPNAIGTSWSNTVVQRYVLHEISQEHYVLLA